MSIIGNVNFNDDSQNFGLIDGAAVFNDNSQNDGIVEGDATFAESSQNNGTVTGDSSFEDSSKNQGSVEGDAAFFDISTNEGIVAGTGTFNNNSVNSGSVENIDLKDNASVTQESIFKGCKGTQIYYPYQKNGLFYVLNNNCKEEIAGYTLMGVYDQGVPNLTPKQITPIKFFGADYKETWDRHSSPSEKEKAINFYEKVYNFLSGEMPPAPLDGPTLDVYEGTRDEWALLLTRMAYFESSYNSDLEYHIGGDSYGVFQMGLGQNKVYKLSAVEVGSQTIYPDFTRDQMRDDDLQLKLAWKALNQNLTVDHYKESGEAVPGAPRFLRTHNLKLALAWGKDTKDKIIRELTMSPKYYSYENGNKHSPVRAHGCYTNGFYRYGMRDYRSVFKPTAAKDTDDEIIQNAVNHDNI